MQQVNEIWVGVVIPPPGRVGIQGLERFHNGQEQFGATTFPQGEFRGGELRRRPPLPRPRDFYRREWMEAVSLVEAHQGSFNPRENQAAFEGLGGGMLAQLWPPPMEVVRLTEWGRSAMS